MFNFLKKSIKNWFNVKRKDAFYEVSQQLYFLDKTLEGSQDCQNIFLERYYSNQESITAKLKT